jgi:hypothetical protein
LRGSLPQLLRRRWTRSKRPLGAIPSANRRSAALAARLTCAPGVFPRVNFHATATALAQATFSSICSGARTLLLPAFALPSADVSSGSRLASSQRLRISCSSPPRVTRSGCPNPGPSASAVSNWNNAKYSQNSQLSGSQPAPWTHAPGAPPRNRRAPYPGDSRCPLIGLSMKSSHARTTRCASTRERAAVRRGIPVRQPFSNPPPLSPCGAALPDAPDWRPNFAVRALKIPCSAKLIPCSEVQGNRSQAIEFAPTSGFAFRRMRLET